MNSIHRDQFIRKRELTKITGLSESTIRRLEIANNFPRRRRTSNNTVAWSLLEVSSWMESRQQA